MIFYRRSCVVLTRPDNNYVQYLASNIPSGVQTTELLPAVQLAGSGVQSGLTVSESSWKCEIWRTIQLISGRQTVNNSQPWYLIFQTRRESGRGSHTTSLSYQISKEILFELDQIKNFYLYMTRLFRDKYLSWDRCLSKDQNIWNILWRFKTRQQLAG